MMELESQEAAWSLLDTDVRNQISTLLYAMTTLSPRLPIVGMCLAALDGRDDVSFFVAVAATKLQKRLTEL